MEHRLGTRRSISAALALHPRGRPPVLTRTLEVSISGMFVDAPADQLGIHEVVDVEMTLPAIRGPRTFRWQAMVIRSTNAGIGLMFDRLRPPAINRLLALLEAELGFGQTAGHGPDGVRALETASGKAAAGMFSGPAVATGATGHSAQSIDRRESRR